MALQQVIYFKFMKCAKLYCRCLADVCLQTLITDICKKCEILPDVLS